MEDANNDNTVQGSTGVQTPSGSESVGAKQVDYSYLKGEAKPREVVKPEITEDMSDDEIERVNTKYEIEKSQNQNRVTEVKTDIIDFLSTTENADVFREYKDDVEKLAMLEGADQFTTKALFFAAGGDRLVEKLATRMVDQLNSIDRETAGNISPNNAPSQAPSTRTQFDNMPRDEFRKLKAQALQGKNIGI